MLSELERAQQRDDRRRISELERLCDQRHEDRMRANRETLRQINICAFLLFIIGIEGIIVLALTLRELAR